MATFKAVIRKDRQREDKTWNVLIRLTHEREVKYIPTSIYVERKDITSSFKIKNQKILDKCDELIRSYRDRISSLFLETNSFSISEIVDYIKQGKKDTEHIDFISFSRNWVNNNNNLKGAKNYISAINSFCTFFGRECIMCDEITTRKMKEYEVFLSGKKRAKSLYTSSIVKLFNEARDFYNDETTGVIIIKDLLHKYTPPKQNTPDKRALSVDIIRSIYELPYLNKTVRGVQCRRDLAKDCFILSFCLMGMNSVDMYNAVSIKDDEITYNRTKTKDRRNDKALMSVKIHPFVKPLIDKYRGNTSVFNFKNRFSSYTELNRSINIGLKEIGKELGIDGLQLYSARHSMATIALNKVGINKYIVNDMLCHLDSSMRVTDIYIEKDFSPINEANFMLIEYVFNEQSNRNPL